MEPLFFVRKKRCLSGLLIREILPWWNRIVGRIDSQGKKKKVENSQDHSPEISLFRLFLSLHVCKDQMFFLSFHFHFSLSPSLSTYAFASPFLSLLLFHTCLTLPFSIFPLPFTFTFLFPITCHLPLLLLLSFHLSSLSFSLFLGYSKLCSSVCPCYPGILATWH